MPYFESNNNGFTLLEVLIAIVITALIGLGSSQILTSAIRTNELTQVRLAELSQLQKLMFFMARDFQQVAPRSIRDGYGDQTPAINTRNDFYVLEFTRVGWRNPLADPRSEMQRVAYELDQEGQLVRHYWQVMDQSQDSAPRSREMLSDIEELSVSFLNASGAWVDEWPPDLDEERGDPHFKVNQMPKALRVQIEHSQFGKLTRLFDLVSYLEHQDAGVAAGASGGNEDQDEEAGGDNNDNTITSVGAGSDEAVKE